MPSPQTLLPLAVAVPLAGAAVLAVAGRRLPTLGCDLLATTTAAACLGVLALLWPHTGHRPGGRGGGEAVATAWTPAGTALGLASAALACLLAATAVRGPGGAPRRAAAALLLPLRRLHSGLLGDYLAWLAVGMAALLVAVAAQL